MIEVIFSIDYEIYGNGRGSLRELVYEPAQELYSIFKEHGAVFVVFAEALEFRKMEEYQADEGIHAVHKQLREFQEDGFEIGLHLHPWWFNAQRENGGWNLAWNERNLCLSPESEIERVVGAAIEYLKGAVGDQTFCPLSFRGGLWLMQPTRSMSRVLSRRGMRVDSSVFKGGRISEIDLDYRPALDNGYYWYFSDDVNSSEPDGRMLEVPIHTEMVPFWKMLGGKRWAVHQRAPRNGNGNPLHTRKSDYLRFRYPRKLDFCRMTVPEFTSVMDRVLQEDRDTPEIYKPVVAIGHTKDLVDFKSVRQFLAYLKHNRVVTTTYARSLRRLEART